MDREKLEHAYSRYGTPLYLFDLDEAAREVGRIRSSLGEGIQLCYAMKANPFLTGKMASLVDRIEVCSMGEFEICKSLGIPPEKLFLSGVLKKREDLEQILKYCGERSRYTAESMAQFRWFVEWADQNGKRLRIYPRLTSGNQFGVDQAALWGMIETAKYHPYVEIGGIHYFSGTMKKQWKQNEKELSYLDRLFECLEKELGFSVPELEYGPGTAVDYFEGKQAETFSPDGMEGLTQLLSGMRWKGTVTVELGRRLAASCGYYFTQVMDVKTNGETNYCIVDGGCHQLGYDGQIKGMYRPHLSVIPDREQEEEKQWTVCGSLCTVNDVLCREIPLRGVAPGTVLVFERAGAYSCMEGMSLFLSHELPGVVLHETGRGWRIARQERQTWMWNMDTLGGNENGRSTENFK